MLLSLGAAVRSRPGAAPVARRVRGVASLQQQEQAQHLDGLAQSHVVGEAGPQAEAREEPEPADPDLLVRAERRPERRARVGRGQRLGLAQALERRREPLPRDHPGPVVPALGRGRRGSVVDGRPGEEAHRLPEGETRAGGALRLLPVGEDLAQLLPVELHPLPAHEDEPVRPGA